jgi:hypothetical protein
MPKEERKEWARIVLKQLEKETNLKNDEFIFLAGDKYREFILPKISDYKVL